MIIVESPFHLTFTSRHNKPSRACDDKCKKVWWDFDFDSRPDFGACHQCGGSLSDAVEGIHYKIIKQSKRGLKLKDFKKIIPEESEKLSDVERMLSNNAVIDHLSLVKEKFVAKAKEEWCATDVI